VASSRHDLLAKADRWIFDLRSREAVGEEIDHVALSLLQSARKEAVEAKDPKALRDAAAELAKWEANDGKRR
jgi:hypothetical protein